MPSNESLWRMNRTRLDAECVRDAVLQITGLLDPTPGGPSAKQFVEQPGVHVTKVADYDGFDVDRPEARRPSIYRFLFRTVPDPFMDAMDCPDASQLAPVRNTSVTALQAHGDVERPVHRPVQRAPGGAGAARDTGRTGSRRSSGSTSSACAVAPTENESAAMSRVREEARPGQRAAA